MTSSGLGEGPFSSLEVAYILEVSPSTVKAWANDGLLTPVGKAPTRFSRHKQLMFTREELVRFMAKRYGVKIND